MKNIILLIFTLAVATGCKPDATASKPDAAASKPDAAASKPDVTYSDPTDDPNFVGC